MQPIFMVCIIKEYIAVNSKTEIPPAAPAPGKSVKSLPHKSFKTLAKFESPSSKAILPIL